MSGVEVFDMPDDVPPFVAEAVQAQLGRQAVCPATRADVDEFFGGLAELIKRAEGEP